MSAARLSTANVDLVITDRNLSDPAFTYGSSATISSGGRQIVDPLSSASGRQAMTQRLKETLNLRARVDEEVANCHFSSKPLHT